MKSGKILMAAAAMTLVPFLTAKDAHASDEGYCREYTRNIQIGMHTENGYGRACLQPDGDWKIVAASHEKRYEEQRPRREHRYEQRRERPDVVIHKSYIRHEGPRHWHRHYPPFFRHYVYDDHHFDDDGCDHHSHRKHKRHRHHH